MDAVFLVFVILISVAGGSSEMWTGKRAKCIKTWNIVLFFSIISLIV